MGAQILRSKGIKVLEIMRDLTGACGIPEVYQGYEGRIQGAKDAIKEGSNLNLYYLCLLHERETSADFHSVVDAVDIVLGTVDITIRVAQHSASLMLYNPRDAKRVLRTSWVMMLNDWMSVACWRNIQCVAVYHTVCLLAEYLRIQPPEMVLREAFDVHKKELKGHHRMYFE